MTNTSEASDVIGGPVTVTLSKPVPAHGENVSQLTFREPTGADLAQAGMPVRFGLVDGEAGMTINPREMTAMLSRLGAVPATTIAGLSAADWTAAAYAVAPFFVPAATSPTSSA